MCRALLLFHWGLFLKASDADLRIERKRVIAYTTLSSNGNNNIKLQCSAVTKYLTTTERLLGEFFHHSEWGNATLLYCGMFTSFSVGLSVGRQAEGEEERQNKQQDKERA